MRVLTVPNWSFGRITALGRQFERALEFQNVRVHFLRSDPDHNRTVAAFSGEFADVRVALLALCEIAFDAIDLNRHMGVHPRIGALDVCPFIALDPSEPLDELRAAVEEVAQTISTAYELPVFLYEKSERGRHESDLPALRQGGFGGLLGRHLRPDFGPSVAHCRLGATVMGVRDFLIAMNVNLATSDPKTAKDLAKQIRRLRTDGDPRFLGVRALGFSLLTRNISQVSLNLTLPNLTPIDPIIDWVRAHALVQGVAVDSTELIGVIRASDVEHATRLAVAPEQVLDL